MDHFRSRNRAKRSAGCDAPLAARQEITSNFMRWSLDKSISDFIKSSHFQLSISNMERSDQGILMEEIRNSERPRKVSRTEPHHVPLSVKPSAPNEDVSEKLKEVIVNEEAALDTSNGASDRWATSWRIKPSANRNITSFTLEQEVGEGTYGTVWCATDKKTQERVAIKELYRENNNIGLSTFAAREIKLLKTLEHDNIVKLKEVVLGSDDDDDSVYLVFEFMKFDLNKLRKVRKAKFSIGQTKNIAAQILSGLSYCHKNQVVHRDIKNANILVNLKGDVKIADFGLARELDEPNARYTRGVVSLWYRCPEVLLGASQYGNEIDIWSVGVLIGELLLGSPLLSGRDEPEQLEQIWKLVGSPSESKWPKWRSLPNADMIDDCREFEPTLSYRLMKHKGITNTCVHFMELLLKLNPNERISAEEALKHPWFDEEPKSCAREDLICDDAETDSSSDAQDIAAS